MIESPIWIAPRVIARTVLAVVVAIELVVETSREAAAVNEVVDLLVAVASVVALQGPVAREVLPVWAAVVVEEAAASVAAAAVAAVGDVKQRTISRTRK